MDLLRIWGWKLQNMTGRRRFVLNECRAHIFCQLPQTFRDARELGCAQQSGTWAELVYFWDVFFFFLVSCVIL